MPQASNSSSLAKSFSQANSWQKAMSDSESSSGAAWNKDQLDRINQLFPQLLKEYGSYGTAAPFSALLSQIGGPATTFPGITAGPIWGEPAIQARVNAMRAGNDASTAGQVKRLADTTAGRGFGTNSPLYQELTSNLAGMNLATNTQGENDLRWNAAQGNAQHVLEAEKAGLSRANMMSQDDLQRRQLALSGRGQDLQFAANRQNALLEALGYYNQPLPFSKSTSKQRSSGGSSSSSESKSRQDSNQFYW